MRVSAAGLVALLCHLALTGAWDVNFKRDECYKYGLENLPERMPATLGNLVALLEKMEGSHAYTNPDAIAEALIHRYRIDGITYASPVANTFWDPNDNYEVNKADLLKSLVTMDQIVPDFTFESREECAIHFMLSHSVDLYPHPGLDYVWENSNLRQRRRRRRDAQAEGRYGLPLNIKPAPHPIENGVIWTPSGPVAAGTLLAGIMVTDTSQGMTIGQIYQSTNLEFMPDLMQQKRVMPLHAATLAGDIGQSALVGYVVQVASSDIYLGPQGMFANSTAAPKLFTLERNYNLNIPYLTRAEVYAGIDSLLIQKVLMESSNNQLSLSEALRMYYSDHGLPNYPDYKACNRMAAFRSLDLALIEEQALNYMYVFSGKIATVRDKMQQYRDDFSLIERAFKDALRLAWNAVTSFVDSYDYSEFDRCPTYTSSQVLAENRVDLLAVYGYEGGETEMQKERDYMAHLGQLLDVGVDRSRLGVLDGKSAKWIFPMTNFSNVADWGSNFSESTTNSYGSGSDMLVVMSGLTAYYLDFYNHLWSDVNNASANAQVVLWNAPNSVPQQEEFQKLMDDFKLKFPDVYFLFVGKSRGSFNGLMVDPNKDYFTNSGQDMVAFARTLATRIRELPTLFTYPACDPDNGNFTNVAESSHIYTGYITPNFTTYIKIAPNYFRFSEQVVLKVTEGDVSICASRTSVRVESNVADKLCSDTATLEWWHLCDRWVEGCDAIYLAVTGSNIRTNAHCQDVECQYPNQIKFQMQHEGLTCGGGAGAAPPALLLLVAALLALLHQQNP
ncbi:hypothetical protein GWK47_013033 [Chionoecetes opilio]|uniref:Uncharacterized protein n=1 Tax=Chionoecetes opilio TaxID=41210 RepID=A0A8J4XWW6_CHIOP|nr:hypothetical protein GWK47_013033 [Chionoecetes opilio]